MSKRKFLVAALIGLVSLGLGATSAWAYLLISATASPTATGATVGTPTVAVGVYNNTAILSWTAPSAPSGATFDYTVSRTSGGGSVSSGCTGTLTTTTCTDTGLTTGTTYVWSVTAVVMSGTTATNFVSNTPGTATAKAAGPLNKFVFSSLTSTSITAGGSVGATVTAQDSAGNVETGYTGTITLGSSDTNGSYNPTTYTFTAADQGQHTFANTTWTLKTAPSQTLSVTAGTVTGTSGSITVAPSSASQIVAISGSGQSTTVSTGFTSPIVAEVEDQYGNGVSGQTVTFQGPTSGASVTFTTGTGTTCASTGTTGAASCTATTGTNGQASSQTMAANGTAGSNFTVTAKADGFTANFTESSTASPPTMTITSPTNQSYASNGSAWNNACKQLLSSSSATNAMCGTDSATSPATVSSVSFTLTRNASPQCWNGSAWVTGTGCAANAATLVSGGIWKVPMSYATLVGGETSGSTNNFSLSMTVTDSNAHTGTASVSFSASAP